MTGWWWRSGSNKQGPKVATVDDGNVLQDIAPDSIRRVHLLGVAGTGMGSFAGLLKAKGYSVSGSDNDVYPPMCEMLKAWGIDVLTPYRPENLDAARPDLVVVGNVIRRVNPEATAARERRLPQMSFPAAFGSLFLAGRHPVVEAALAGSHSFVPNHCDLSPDRRLLLLTGPNMAGKSTYLRQNALIAILAQAGLPVPAKRAAIGLIDRLFSRVGGSDDLARGQSTFMVEMTETAAILHQAGPRSLVIIDEIGRGTATLDGLAIAWAVLEALHFSLRCRTIFATHFHELARLNGELSRMRPHTMRVKDWKGGVVFLHEVAEGAGGRSFGVHVAELAGVPAPTVRRAAALLTALERDSRIFDAGSLPLFSAAAPPVTEPPVAVAPLEAAMREINPEELTPRQALDIMYRLKSLSTASDPDQTEQTSRRC